MDVGWEADPPAPPRHRRRTLEIQDLAPEGYGPHAGSLGLVGRSRAILELGSRIASLAPSPATVLVHGTNDTDVPYEQSTLMAAEFKKHGIAHELITVPDAEHGLAGADPVLVAAAYQSAWDFVKRYLRPR